MNPPSTLRRTALLTLLGLGMLGAVACELNQPSPPLSKARRVFDPRYHDWNQILTRYVSPAGVDYAGLKRDNRFGLLTIALEEMLQVTPEQFDEWPRETKLAFLINAHNAHAMMRVLRAYPVESLGETTGFFNSARGVRNIRLLGREWSLATLAEEITGDPYHESRALFLLNWGARGCVPLHGAAVTAQNLNDLLERRTREFMTDPRNHEYDHKKHILYLPRLLGWYREPLERDFVTVWDFVRHYLTEAELKKIMQRNTPPRLRYPPFDMSLNDAAAAKTAAGQ